jgi:hypothetical protein
MAGDISHRAELQSSSLRGRRCDSVTEHAAGYIHGLPGGGQGDHLARVSSSKGPQAQRMSKFQKILVMRSSFSKRHILWTFKLDCKPKELLQEILGPGLCGLFPNIIIAMRIFVSLPESVDLGERTFNVFKQFKNYCRSTVRQLRLNVLPRSVSTMTLNYNALSDKAIRKCVYSLC